MRMIPVRVLLLEEDRAAAGRIVSALVAAHYDAVAFSDAPAALQHLAAAACQVALVALRLSEADAGAVIAEAARIAPATRIIAMTAFPEVSDVLLALRAGARDLLEKPVQPAALLAAVERQLSELGLGIRNEEDLNRRLGQRVRDLRTQSGRAQNAVAEACGLSPAQLSQIELGRTGTSVWTLARLAAALDVPLVRLVERL